jgi:hypothetical protein
MLRVGKEELGVGRGKEMRLWMRWGGMDGDVGYGKGMSPSPAENTYTNS